MSFLSSFRQFVKGQVKTLKSSTSWPKSGIFLRAKASSGRGQRDGDVEDVKEALTILNGYGLVYLHGG